MKRALVGLCLVLSSTFAWALPTEQQIQDQVKQGNYTQAESMMSDVVAAKPDNAKAHYIYAELLAHNGNFNKAAEEMAKVRRIDPKYGANDPAFRSFEQTLEREQNPSSRSRVAPTSYGAPSTMSSASSHSGVPGWVWIVGLLVVAMVLWRGFMRSRATGVGQMAPAGFNGGYGPGQAGVPYGPGGGPVVGGGGGSGLLGTGLAVAGGVAGGMLLDEMLHKRSDGGAFNPGGGGFDNSGSDSAARELEDRQIDFGGGNGWDSGGGGGIDMGGGGGGSDGGSWE